MNQLPVSVGAFRAAGGFLNQKIFVIRQMGKNHLGAAEFAVVDDFPDLLDVAEIFLVVLETKIGF